MDDVSIDIIRLVVDEHHEKSPWYRPNQQDHKGEAMDIMGLKLFRTCESCPEQYNVFYEEIPVAYVRFRWGQLTVECPHVGGEYILVETIDGGGLRGILFEHERDAVLELCAKQIIGWMKEVSRNQI